MMASMGEAVGNGGMENPSDRTSNGRFAVGHKMGGPKCAGKRINALSLARRKSEEHGLNLDELMWDVMLITLLNGAKGCVKSAALAHKMLCEQEPKGPMIAIGINATNGIPQPPPLKSLDNGAPALGEHLKRLVAIAKQRGLADLIAAEPVDVVTTIIDRAKEAKEAENDDPTNT